MPVGATRRVRHTDNRPRCLAAILTPVGLCRRGIRTIQVASDVRACERPPALRASDDQRQTKLRPLCCQACIPPANSTTSRNPKCARVVAAIVLVHPERH